MTNLKKVNRSIVSTILVLFFFLPGSMVGAQNTPTDEGEYKIYGEIAEGLVCLCGCGSNIKGCPHKQCGFANPVKAEITSRIKQGQPKEEITSFFINKYGDKILTTPPKQGFNLVGYILPGFLVVVVGIFIILIIRKWSSEGHAHLEEELREAEENSEDDSSYRDQLKKELDELDEY